MHRAALLPLALVLAAAPGCNDGESPTTPLDDTGSVVGPTQGTTEEPAPEGPVVATVNVRSHDGNQIRQGGTRVSVEIVGERLSDAALVLDLPFEVDENTDTRIVFRTSAPTEAALGARDLTVRTADGEATVAAALEVVPITVSPTGDDKGAGTTDDPYQTIAHAVAQADEGQVVRLLAGTYGDRSGEAFPVQIADVALEGAGADKTQIVGDGSGLGLRLSGTTSLEGLLVARFDAGIRTNSGNHVLNEVHVSGNAGVGFSTTFVGSDLESVTVRSSEFSDNGTSGFDAVSGDKPAVFNLEDSVFTGNGVRGLYVIQQAEVTMSGCELSENGVGIEMIQTGSLVAKGLVIVDNDEHGIEASGSAVLDLNLSEISSNGESGIEFGGGTFTLRGSEVINNTMDGIRLTSRPVVDLGTKADPGKNRIGVDGFVIVLGDRLADDRSSRATPAIQAVGIDLDMPKGPSGLQVGEDADSPFWRILRDGNEIDFGE